MIKSTYTLDVESVRMLEDLASHLATSKSDVLRRAIRSLAAATPSGENPALNALDRLQASVRERNVDLEQWERENAVERAADARRRPLT